MWRNPAEIAGNGVDDDNNGYVDDVFGINAISGSGNPFDDNDHGTHVAGTIGATANGGGPHVGVAWNVRLMALKFLPAAGGGLLSDAIECINYAISKGANIMNNSWGGGGFSTALSNAIERARVANILFVAAAGNEGSNNDVSPAYPASYTHANIVSVAAIDRRNQRASFSNFGRSSVDLAAPGVEIFFVRRRFQQQLRHFQRNQHGLATCKRCRRAAHGAISRYTRGGCQTASDCDRRTGALTEWLECVGWARQCRRRSHYERRWLT